MLQLFELRRAQFGLLIEQLYAHPIVGCDPHKLALLRRRSQPRQIFANRIDLPVHLLGEGTLRCRQIDSIKNLIEHTNGHKNA
ncbi:hypothetical protein D3C81_2134210 [compost metagenome]